MLHTVLRRRANGEFVEQIQPALIIPTGKRKGRNPSVASIYRAPAESPNARRTPKLPRRPPPTSPPSKPAKSPAPACYLSLRRSFGRTGPSPPEGRQRNR
ncbi:hypothetical protein [Streptomyces sp. NPDC024089]|uniref:hypothetical protein n=1 Tax=Streptomyces sp. NPDC024089 TaxID=3154328 RepID=UPI003405765C